MSDYPEYLNPFSEDVKVKPKLAIRHSFKEFKRTLRQSFRIKKKDEEVTLRQKNDVPQRLPVTSYPSYQSDTLLPRSRFKERVSRNEFNGTVSGPNPFEDEENRETKSRLLTRKTKKRAPLPPKSISSQHINNDTEVPVQSSHWSLTSVDTDCSAEKPKVQDDEEEEVKRESIVEKFVDFNKNMESLKDDTNNNIVKEEVIQDTETDNVPDLVVTCPVNIKNGDDSKKSEDESDDELIVKDITDNMIVEKKDDETDKCQENTEPFLYHEKEYIYIAGSRDELNTNTYRGSMSLYVTGSCDDLDNNNDDTTPIPKQRKNKLSKTALLGV